MRVIIQRVTEANVQIEEKVKGKIKFGLVILIGIEENDKVEDADWLVKKIVQLRIFSDGEGKMNLSLMDIQGSVLLISQFTLHASTKKGNRPSFIKAAKPDISLPLYHHFIQKCIEIIGPDKVATGEFGADMKISLVNDGPVTIIMDSKQKE